jgi:hypothetical protein
MTGSSCPAMVTAFNSITSSSGSSDVGSKRKCQMLELTHHPKRSTMAPASSCLTDLSDKSNGNEIDR